MAVAKNEVQILWAAALFKSVVAGVSATSDAFSFSANAVQAVISLKADNDGSQASGDTMTFYILYTSGDPDGTGADEFDTDATATASNPTFLATLDTNANDPQLLTVPINAAAKGGKIFIKNNSAGRAITGSATISEITA